MKERARTQIVVRESMVLPLMIVLYGVPVVLLILLSVLAWLGIQLGIRWYREKQQEINQLESISMEEEESDDTIL